MKKLIAVILFAGLGAATLCFAGGTLQLQASFFDAGGPVMVSPEQTASVCASNLGSQTVSVLIALLNANTAPNGPNNGQQTILAVRESPLDPGKGFCLSKTGAELRSAVGPNQQNILWDTNVIAVVVPGGVFTGTTDAGGGILQPGTIIQQGSVGALSNYIGTIQPSLQILGPGTLIYPNMVLRKGTPGGGE